MSEGQIQAQTAPLTLKDRFNAEGVSTKGWTFTMVGAMRFTKSGDAACIYLLPYHEGPLRVVSRFNLASLEDDSVKAAIKRVESVAPHFGGWAGPPEGYVEVEP